MQPCKNSTQPVGLHNCFYKNLSDCISSAHNSSYLQKQKLTMESTNGIKETFVKFFGQQKASSNVNQQDIKATVSKYFGQQEVKTLYDTLESGAKAIDVACKTVDFFTSDVLGLLATRLPAIASKLTKLTKFAGLLGPAGV